jgi:hypothetical protein
VLAEIDDGSCQHLRAAVERFNGLGANWEGRKRERKHRRGAIYSRVAWGRG